MPTSPDSSSDGPLPRVSRDLEPGNGPQLPQRVPKQRSSEVGERGGKVVK